MRYGLRLIRLNREFLLGQRLSSTQIQEVRAGLLDHPRVTAVHQVLAIYIGPNQVWIVARVSVNPSPRVEQISSIVRELDAGLRQASEAIFRVDIVTASYP